MLWDCYRNPVMRRGGRPAQAGEARKGQGTASLDCVSFAIRPGATLGLLGPNGAGKTTTIRCITGEEQPSAGSVALRPAARAYGHDACIGLCMQETVLIEDLTVEEHFLFYTRINGTPRALQKACTERWLRATQLEEKRTAFPHQLS